MAQDLQHIDLDLSCLIVVLLREHQAESLKSTRAESKLEYASHMLLVLYQHEAMASLEAVDNLKHLVKFGHGLLQHESIT